VCVDIALLAGGSSAGYGQNRDYGGQSQRRY